MTAETVPGTRGHSISLHRTLGSAPASDLAEDVLAPHPAATRILGWLNSYRLFLGLKPLAFFAPLMNAATSHCADFVRLGYGADPHNVGEPWVERIDWAGYTNWTTLRENVAKNWGYPDPVWELWQQWLVSSPHRENMEAGDVTRIGIAVSHASGVTFGCMDLGAP